ncbi:MAG: AAA family ATPase [Burkholderiales bacterium]|nr:AAA family ATPase [Burkholderiales bacterium]
MPKQLPAAFLLFGQEGVGKQLLARALSQSLLCENAAVSGEPCGHCDGCHLFEVGNHPDFRLLQPDRENGESGKNAPTKGVPGAKKPSALISVDAVRDLAGLTATAAHRGGVKVIMIDPAESLHPSAGNALLKMLEEPGKKTHFILVTNKKNSVLPTIRSRCFQLPVQVPTIEEARSWLAITHSEHVEIALCLASYAPFAALELVDNNEFWERRHLLLTRLADAAANPLDLASLADQFEPVALGRMLSMWVFDLLALQQGADIRYHRDMRAELTVLASTVVGSELCNWSDEVRAFSRAAQHPLNRRLALESLFAHWPGSRIRLAGTSGQPLATKSTFS